MPLKVVSRAAMAVICLKPEAGLSAIRVAATQKCHSKDLQERERERKERKACSSVLTRGWPYGGCHPKRPAGKQKGKKYGAPSENPVPPAQEVRPQYFEAQYQPGPQLHISM
jgi:hypothetical protein